MRSLLAAICLLSVAASQADNTPFDERFSITVGAFNASLDTEVLLQGTDELSNLAGESIRLEEQLDLDGRDTIVRVDGWFRLADRHRLGFSASRLDRKAETDINEQIQFGDAVFDVNTTVRSRFDAEILDLSYRYSVLKNERTELDFSLGVHTIRLKASIATLDETLVEQAEGSGPLPLLGVGVKQAISDKLFFSASGRWLRAKVGNLDGRVFDASAGFDYRFTDNFGVAAYYNHFKLSTDINSSLWTGEVDFMYRGPQLSATLRF